MADTNGSTIKWRDMILVFVLAVGIPMGALLWHKEAPHDDAVSKDVFTLFASNLDHKLEEVNKKLDELKESLEQIKNGR